MTQRWALLIGAYLSMYLAAAQHHRAQIMGTPVCFTSRPTRNEASNTCSIVSGNISLLDETATCKALYPSAYRIKRGAYSLIDPTFQRSEEDVNLLFEILLAGMQIPGGEQDMQIPDEELASLRSVDKLEVICEDVLPKRLSDIRRLTAELARRRRPLSRPDFERTVLTLVYAAQTLARLSGRQQREAWADAVMQLSRAVQKDLGLS